MDRTARLRGDVGAIPELLTRTDSASRNPARGHVQLLQSCLNVAPWTGARQALLPMGFSRQEYWSELPFLPPRDLPEPGIEPVSPASQVGAFTAEPPGKPQNLAKRPKCSAGRLVHKRNLLPGFQ